MSSQNNKHNHKLCTYWAYHWNHRQWRTYTLKGISPFNLTAVIKAILPKRESIQNLEI